MQNNEPVSLSHKANAGLTVSAAHSKTGVICDRGREHGNADPATRPALKDASMLK